MSFSAKSTACLAWQLEQKFLVRHDKVTKCPPLQAGQGRHAKSLSRSCYAFLMFRTPDPLSSKIVITTSG